MPVTILDLVVIGVVLISALLAAVRGFTREVLAIASWVAAAAVAWVFHPQLVPFVKQYIPANSRRTRSRSSPRCRAVPRHADRRLAHHGADLRLRPRLAHRRARSHARLRLRRGARPAAGGDRLPLLRGAGAAARSMPVWVKDAKAKPMLRGNRPLADRDAAAGRQRRFHQEPAEKAEGGGNHRGPGRGTAYPGDGGTGCACPNPSLIDA